MQVQKLQKSFLALHKEGKEIVLIINIKVDTHLTQGIGLKQFRPLCL